MYRIYATQDQMKYIPIEQVSADILMTRVILAFDPTNRNVFLLTRTYASSGSYFIWINPFRPNDRVEPQIDNCEIYRFSTIKTALRYLSRKYEIYLFRQDSELKEMLPFLQQATENKE